jgi:hypothetical protein
MGMVEPAREKYKNLYIYAELIKEGRFEESKEYKKKVVSQ